MRLSKLFFRTFKEAPAEADIPSHQLLERGGYIRRLGRGLYSYTPLMARVLKKLSDIIREEMERAGCQEISLPLLHPADLWKASGRYEGYVSEKILYTTTDREENEYCLAPTHEEVVTSLVKDWLTSYKHLPVNLFQIGNKFRDEIRPRFGLMRGKEFLMKDGYSFSDSPEMMEKQYALMGQAYRKVFDRLELDYVVVEAHGGKIGAGKSEEFQVRSDVGEDAVMVCGDYAVNVEQAAAIPPAFTYESDEKPKERLDTPNLSTIEELEKFSGLKPHQMVKTVILKLVLPDLEEFVAIGMRGDRQVNPLKVATKFGALEVEMASDEEILKLTGCKPGFAGPINLEIPFHADKTCKTMTNFLCAANEPDVHYLNVNWERDCPRPEFDDYLLAEEGDACPHVPEGTYSVIRGIEVGHIFNIGTKYSEALGAKFQDENGKTRPFHMGTYGIGVGRSAQAVVEQKHDERGIVWPLSLAPYKIFITAANTKNEAQVEVAEKLYAELQEAHLEPLLDDRPERIGFKLRDSDLIGIPFKVIVGKAFESEGKVEIETRQGEKSLHSPDDVLNYFSSIQVRPTGASPDLRNS